MKNLVHEILFGKNSLVSGGIALAVVLSIALGCNCGKTFDLANLAKESNSSNTSKTSDDDSKTSSSSSEIPSNAVVEDLVKETMSDFSEAVDSGDFADIYNKASTDFQDTYTLDEMTKAFKSYTDKKKLVVPILNKVPSLDAEFDHPPGLRSEQKLSILMASGKFSTKPYHVRFDFEYVKRGGEWKLLKLVINIP